MATIRIDYRDPDRPADEVIVGAFGQIAAKRRFGLDAVKEGDPEAALFAAYVEIEGVQAAGNTTPAQWDEWLQSVTGYDLVEDEADEEDPTTEATPSPPSPVSPSTSE